MNRPAAVHPKATFRDDTQEWSLEQPRSLRTWDAQGVLLRTRYRDRSTEPPTWTEFNHDGGSVRVFHAAVGDDAAHTGVAYRNQAGDLGPSLPASFPDEVKSIRFEVADFDDVTLRYEARNLSFFDNSGARLRADGTRCPPPSATAVLVGAHGEKNLWRDGALVGEQRDGTWLYHRMDGTKFMQERYEAGELRSLQQFDATGSRATLDWSFGDGGSHLRVDSDEMGVFEAAWSRATREVRYVHEGEPISLRVDLAPIATAEEFVQRYQQLFSRVEDSAWRRSIDVYAGTLQLGGGAAVDRYEDTIKLAVVLNNGSGDEFLVIEEPGTYQGRVFYNMHDEGLSCMDGLDEYIEDEGLEGDKDALIEQLPFFEEDDESSTLTALFDSLALVPRNDPRALSQKLSPQP